MNIFNKLRITYNVESRSEKNKFNKFTILVDGEDILIKNSNFSQIPLKKQLLIVDSFIVKDRIRYKTKEFIDRKWEEV
jgi:hypothetical protein